MPADLVIRIRADDQQGIATLKRLAEATEDVGKTSEKQGSLLGGLGDVLGKVGLAAMGAGAIFGTASAAIGGLIGPAQEAQKVSAQLDSVLRSTGGAAGVTRDAALALSDSLSKMTAFDDEAIQSGENLLLTFTNIGSDVFPQATETMLDMSQALGQDLQSSAIQLGKALNDPIKGVTALQRVGVSFTEQQKEEIKAMAQAGDTAGAQALILKELQKEFGGAAKAAGETFAGKLAQAQTALGNVQEAIGGALLPVLTDLLNAVTPLLVALGEHLPDAISTVEDALSPLIGVIRDVLIPNVLDVGRIVTAVFEGDFQAAVDVLQTSIVPRIQEFGGAVLSWLEEQIPVLVAKLGEWAAKFIEWVKPAIPPLLGELRELLAGVGTWLVESAPGLEETFISQWVPAAIGWVANAAVTILPELAKLSLAVGTWVITDGIPALVDFGLQLAGAILSGVASGLTKLGEVLKDGLRPGIADALKYLDDQRPEFLAAGGRIAGDIAKGLASGLAATASFNPVQLAASALAKKAIDAAKQTLDEHSESRVFWQIGAFAGEGFASGIVSTLAGVQTAAATLTQTIIPAAEETAAAFVALGDDGFTHAATAATQANTILGQLGEVFPTLTSKVATYVAGLQAIPTSITTTVSQAIQTVSSGGGGGGGGSSGGGGGGGGGGSSGATSIRPGGKPGETPTEVVNFLVNSGQTPAQAAATVAGYLSGATGAAVGQSTNVGGVQGHTQISTSGGQVGAALLNAITGKDVLPWQAGPIDYDRLAQALEGVLVRAMSAVQLGVAVDDVHSGLLRKQRGLGTLGFR